MSNSSNDMALFQQFQAFKRMMDFGNGQGNQGSYPRSGQSGQSGQRRQKQPYDPKIYDGKYKKSGAKFGHINHDKKTSESDGVYVMGWFKRKSCGFVQVKGFAKYKYVDPETGEISENSAFFEDKNGRKGVKMRFEVFYKDTGAVIQDYGFYYFDTGVVFLKNTGIIVCTKAPHGGTCSFFKKEENRK